MKRCLFIVPNHNNTTAAVTIQRWKWNHPRMSNNISGHCFKNHLHQSSQQQPPPPPQLNRRYNCCSTGSSSYQHNHNHQYKEKDHLFKRRRWSETTRTNMTTIWNQQQQHHQQLWCRKVTSSSFTQPFASTTGDDDDHNNTEEFLVDENEHMDLDDIIITNEDDDDDDLMEASSLLDHDDHLDNIYTATTTTTNTNTTNTTSNTNTNTNTNTTNRTNDMATTHDETMFDDDDDIDVEEHQRRVEILRNSRSRFIINIPGFETPSTPENKRRPDPTDDDDMKSNPERLTRSQPQKQPWVIYKVPTRVTSLVQERIAAQQLPHMESETMHILSQKSFRTLQCSVEVIQRIYLYWLSKPVRDIFYNNKVTASVDRGDYNTVDHDTYRPVHLACNIVHWFMGQFDDVHTTDEERQVLANAMMTFLNSNGESKNTGLCRLMSLFCQPLMGTNATIKEYGGRRMDADGNNPKFHVSNLVYAGKIWNIMQRMHEDNIFFPNVVPDGQSYQSILNLIGKRCRLLVLLGPPPRVDGIHFPRVRRGVRWSDQQTIDALGGCRVTRDCIDMALQVIQEMKSNPMTRPSMIHYSLVLSMISYSAGVNIGIADEAYTILNEIRDDPTMEESIALYNPVLLSYVMEAAEHQKQKRYEEKRLVQQKCEVLWDQMQNHRDPNIASNPISYSIMIKLYRNLDEAAKAQEILERMEAAAVLRSSPPPSSSSLNEPVTMNNLDFANTITQSKSLPPDPTLMHYNTVLNAWAKSSDLQSGERAMALVRRMEEQTLAVTGLHHPIVPRPDHVSFTSTLDALLRGPNVPVTIAHMEKILQRFESSEEIERRPDSVTYNVIFHSLNRQLRRQRDEHVRSQIADEMEQLLYRLQNHSTNFRAVAGPRLFRYYNECIRAWSGTNSPQCPARAIQLLRKMDELRLDGTFPSAKPNGTTYQHLLFAISSASDEEYAEFCKEIFTKMEHGNIPVTVTALLTYLSRLLRYRFEGTPDEADDAFVETIMERFRAKKERNDAFVAGMVFQGIFTNINRETDTWQKLKWTRRYEKLFRALMKEPEHLRLDHQELNLTFFYNSCIKAWAFARTPESTANALRLLREMEDTCRTTTFDVDSLNSCHPNVKTYEYILTCLSRSPDLISVNSAREIFHKMELGKIRITLSLLNRFIRILSQSGVRGALQEAEHILKIVEDDFLANRAGSLCPNLMSYSILVEGYMRSNKGLHDAERIIDYIKILSEKDGMSELRPPAKLYIDLINRWSESVAVEAIERVDSLFKKMAEISKPNNYEYSILQAAWCRSKRPDAPHQVESILVSMQQEYESGKNLAARPAIENFDLVIKAWATNQQPKSVERADAILRRLEDLCYSDRGAYNTMRPSTSCYQHALLGWTLSNSPEAGERAVAILDRMKQHQSIRGAPSINQACYHHAMAAIGKSNTMNKAAKCYDIFEEMRIAYESRRNRYSWPTHETFQSVMGVCATCTNSSAEREEALEVCVKTMKEYVKLSHMGPRTDVYVQFLYALFRLLPAGTERDDAVLSIFADEQYKCPAAIFDAIHVRDALHKTVSPKVLADIARTCGRNPLLKSLNRGRFT